MDLLVCDVGTSSIRAAIVHDDATVAHEHHEQFLPDSPAPGLVEFDPAAMARTVLETATAALAAHGGPVAAVGVTNQRGSAVVWDRTTGEPIGPGQGWQDLRTLVACLTHQAAGFRFAPNAAATKFESILDTFDPDRDPRPLRRHRGLLDRVDALATAPSMSPTRRTRPSRACAGATGAGGTTMFSLRSVSRHECCRPWSIPRPYSVRPPRSRRATDRLTHR